MKKVANFGFLKYSIFEGKSNKSDRKTGNRKSGRMCLTMDAKLNQWPYQPKVGDEVNVSYNRYGRCDGMAKA